jgi:glycerol-3-phosphate acyltransferase PlsX
MALAHVGEQLHVDLVGQHAVVERELDTLLHGEYADVAPVRARVHVVDAPDVIEMTDRPTVALRAKVKSSMVTGIRRVADGVSHAFVSAGNTGAQMAASLMHLKLHEGLTRPAIGTIFPTSRQPVLVLDSGANVDCSPEELVQFAQIGAVYAECLLGRTLPAIGLLSIGEEAEKGNVAVKEAHQRLRASGVNFVGNVEGRDIPQGAIDSGPIDVVVCDGFTGNVLLKFYERLAPMVIGLVARSEGLDAHAVAARLRELDADEYGGAPLLGVRGVSVISHGKSSPKALMNAIRVAARAVETGMSDAIGVQLQRAAAAHTTSVGGLS